MYISRSLFFLAIILFVAYISETLNLKITFMPIYANYNTADSWLGFFIDSPFQ